MSLRRFSISLVCIVSILAGVGTAQAVQDWNAGSGSWFLAGNWTPNGVPGVADTANVNNGGTAIATSGGPLQAFSVNVGKNGGTGSFDVSNVSLELQQSLDLGDVEATFTTSGSNVSSSGSASFVGSPSLSFGLAGLGDLNVGQTSASLGATAMGTANLTIDQVGTVTIPGDMDLGQTSGDGTATGNGTGTVTGITTMFSIGGDLDVGQTSAGATGSNSGIGDLTIDDGVQLSVAADVDVAQTTGGGTSSGQGLLVLDDINQITIGDSLDVGKIRAFNTADNQANGQVTIRGSDALIGFSAVNPGSVEIARVLVSEAALGRGTGMVTFDDAGVDVANDVIVGELALGGTNSSNFADAKLYLIDSKLDARDVSVAQRFDNTSGSVNGQIDMTRSLMVVQGSLLLSNDATITMRINGQDRAIGDGLATDYSAIDADLSTVAGTLEILSEDTYLGPTLRGEQNSFDLITVLFGMTGSFSEVTYDGTAIGSSFSYVGATQNGDDGLFAAVEQTSGGVTVTNYLAIPGDANGDMIVDGQDFIVWNNFKFTSGTNWSQADFNGDGITDGQDFVVWNNFKFTSTDFDAVPEPYFSGGALLVAVFWRSRRLTCWRRK